MSKSDQKLGVFSAIKKLSNKNTTSTEQATSMGQLKTITARIRYYCDSYKRGQFSMTRMLFEQSQIPLKIVDRTDLKSDMWVRKSVMKKNGTSESLKIIVGETFEKIHFLATNQENFGSNECFRGSRLKENQRKSHIRKVVRIAGGVFAP